ncbi:septal ring lytic transglycosylase RlpA family protein [Nitrosomonas sp. Nm51]|uniref:septal ring lytic transglycosylase RlpA family protein n=1 Tax=Nitrosomonas sp. Nm51 TaxID=133720 RepID=UPI0027379F30|nr:septal ring lytic transglycosylase RlpA family protein [Nitrosomonas sp. Nm51]
MMNTIQKRDISPLVWRLKGKNSQNIALAILSALIVFLFLFAGCTSPIKPPVPRTAVTVQPPQPSNASYNRSYTVRGKTYYPMRSATGYSEHGIASWYGSESGSRTAMGTRFNPHGLTAAHKTLPLPTKVRVTNLRNGRSVDVVVNDRGPFKKNRLIDLSHGAAKKIGLDKQGLGKVKVEYLESLAVNP